MPSPGPATRRRRPSRFRSAAPRRQGSDRAAARAARRRDHLRAGRRARPEALKHVQKGGRVVCAGIHMSDIPAFPYADLWGERRSCSVANLTRADGAEFLEIAARVPVKTQTTTFPLAQANEALDLSARRRD